MSSPTTPTRKRTHSSISDPDLDEMRSANKKTRTEHSPTQAIETSTAESDGNSHRVDSVEPLASRGQTATSKNGATSLENTTTPTESVLVEGGTATGSDANNELARLQKELAKARAEIITLKQNDQARKPQTSEPRSPNKVTSAKKLEAFEEVYGNYESQAKNLKRLADEKKAKGTKMGEDRLKIAKQARPVPATPTSPQQTIKDLETNLAAQQATITDQDAQIKKFEADQKDFHDSFNGRGVREVDRDLTSKHQQVRRDAIAIARLEKRVKQQDGQLESLNFEKSMHNQVLKTRDNDIDALIKQRKVAEHQLELRKGELERSEEKLNKTLAANIDLEKSAEMLHKSKAGHRKTAADLDESNKATRAQLKKKDFQLKSIGDRCARCVAYIAQLKGVVRENSLDLPKPAAGMEFSGWDDKKGPKEAVEAFRGGK